MTAVLDAPVLEGARAGTQVLGVHCKNSHFNDPAVAYCAVCGIAMTQSDRVPVLGDRPPLGVVIDDGGTMYPLSRDLVVGRAPEADEAVASGAASPVRVTDPLVSRVHARVVLDGWTVTVVDAGSRNGTFVWAPGQASWTRVRPGEAAELRPGTVVAFGRHQLSYHSYRHR